MERISGEFWFVRLARVTTSHIRVNKCMRPGRVDEANRGVTTQAAQIMCDMGGASFFGNIRGAATSIQLLRAYGMQLLI